jgi:hypothetical protein
MHPNSKRFHYTGITGTQHGPTCLELEYIGTRLLLSLCLPFCSAKNQIPAQKKRPLC